MQGAFLDSFAPPELTTTGEQPCCVGQIVQLTAEGQALVDYPGNPGGPVQVRSVVPAPPVAEGARPEGMRVLLLFENGDATQPIIVGIVRDAFCPPAAQEPAAAAKKPRDVVVDGTTLVFDARDEIMLRCGKSSLTLKKDGTIIVKGTHLVSRSSGVNKIKGATVTIN